MNDDLISRSALLDYCDAKAFNALELWDGGMTREAWLEAFETVRTAPAVDAEPVRHGRWIPVELHKSFGVLNGVKCSMCGEGKVVRRYNYCPNCGARMDGDVNA